MNCHSKQSEAKSRNLLFAGSTKNLRLLALSAFLFLVPCVPAHAQQAAIQSVGHIDISATTERIQVSGPITLSGTSTLLGNGSAVTAGHSTLPIHLTRGGELDLCATTELHLSQENNAAAADSPLMLSLDRGAIEAHYSIGKNSDVVLTPDLRILLSGPGKADVRIRINAQGDTCIENRSTKNHEQDAPYLTVTEQIGTGVYRVQANQRVLFEHGSVRNVIDNEHEPCGCPPNPPAPAIVAEVAPAQPLKPVKKITAAPSAVPSAVPSTVVSPAGPSSTPADTEFPLAESEGLAEPPPPPSQPVAAPGQTHTQVTSTFSYTAPTQTVPTGDPNGVATPESAATTATAPAPGFGIAENAAPQPAVTPPQPAPPIAPAPLPTQPPQTSFVPAPKPPTAPGTGFFHKLGHFLARIFG